MWKGSKGKGRYGLEFLLINRVKKARAVCDLRCIPDEAANKMRNKKDCRLE